MKSLLLIACLMFTIPVFCQTTQEGFVPRLNGHSFVDAATRNAPFTKTTMSIKTGVASTDEVIFPLTFGTDTTLLGIEGSVLFVQGEFFYQQRIKDWLAVYMKVGFALRTGNELNSIALEGINTLSSFELGWKFKLIRSQKFMMSGLFNITNNEAVLIDVSAWLNSLLRGQTPVSINQEVPALYSSLGVNASWAIGPLLAVNGSLFGGWGESINRGETGFNYTAKFSIEADLYAKTKVPLGFKASYIGSTTPVFLWGERGSASTFDLIMAYTQSEDFRISLETYLSQTPYDDLDGKVRFAGFTVNLQYYFN